MINALISFHIREIDFSIVALAKIQKNRGVKKQVTKIIWTTNQINTKT